MTPPRDFWDHLDGENWPHLDDDPRWLDVADRVAYWTFLAAIAIVLVRLLVQAVTS